MSFAVLRVTALASVFLLISGCGGSSGSGSGGGGGNPSTTTITFSITGQAPTAVATQIGSGPFTAARLTSGAVSLTLPSGTTNFAVAFVCPLTPPNSTFQWTSENIFEASALDGTSYTEGCLPQPQASTTGTLTGSVDASAIPGVSYVNVDAQTGDQNAIDFVANPVSSFSFAAPAGTDRVEVLAYSESLLNATEGTFSLAAAKNLSGQTVPGALNGGNTVVLGAADETTEQTITYSGIPSGFGAPGTSVNYVMGGFGLWIGNALSGQYPAMPAGAMQSGDYYSFISGVANSAGSEVMVLKNSTTAGPISIAYPTPWSYAGPTPAALPVFDLAYSGFTGNAGVYNHASITWPSTGSPESIIQVYATGNFMNGSTSLALPDLSSLAGFLAPPTSGTQVLWVATVAQGTHPSFQAMPANATMMSVINSGTYTVP